MIVLMSLAVWHGFCSLFLASMQWHCRHPLLEHPRGAGCRTFPQKGYLYCCCIFKCWFLQSGLLQADPSKEWTIFGSLSFIFVVDAWLEKCNLHCCKLANCKHANVGLRPRMYHKYCIYVPGTRYPGTTGYRGKKHYGRYLSYVVR